MLEGETESKGGELAVVKYAALCYLIGSIPFAYICTRFFHGGDIRCLGSSNVGTTNVVRQVGWVAGLLTLIGDMFKGWLAAVISTLAPLGELRFVMPAFTILGHNWPVWLSFKGGGGLATFVGSCLVFSNLKSALMGIAIWGVCYFILRDHDRSALTACIGAPLLYAFVGESIETLLFYGSSSFVIALRRLQSMSIQQPLRKIQA